MVRPEPLDRNTRHILERMVEFCVASLEDEGDERWWRVARVGLRDPIPALIEAIPIVRAYAAKHPREIHVAIEQALWIYAQILPPDIRKQVGLTDLPRPSLLEPPGVTR